MFDNVTMCGAVLWSSVLSAGPARPGQRQGGREALLVSTLEEPGAWTFVNLQENTENPLLCVDWLIDGFVIDFSGLFLHSDAWARCEWQERAFI